MRLPWTQAFQQQRAIVTTLWFSNAPPIGSRGSILQIAVHNERPVCQLFADITRLASSLAKFAEEIFANWERSASVLNILNSTLSVFWQIQISRTKVLNLFQTADAEGICWHFSFLSSRQIDEACFKHRVETTISDDYEESCSWGKLKSTIEAAAKNTSPLIPCFCPFWRPPSCFSSYYLQLKKSFFEYQMRTWAWASSLEKATRVSWVDESILEEDNINRARILYQKLLKNLDSTRTALHNNPNIPGNAISYDY